MAAPIKDIFGLALLSATVVAVTVHLKPWHKEGVTRAMAEDARRPGALVLLDVNVRPMDREVVLHRHVVVVENGIVTQVAPLGAVEPPKDALVVDGHGTSYVIPGLTDAHVHLDEGAGEWLPLLVRKGVTTVFAASGAGSWRPEAAGVESLPAPTMYYIGDSGSPEASVEPIWPSATDLLALDAETAPPAVDPSSLEAMAAEWSRVGAWFTPRLVASEAVLRQWGSPDGLATGLRLGSSGLVPRGMLDRWINDNPYTGRDPAGRSRLEELYGLKQRFLRALHHAGAPVLAGSGTPVPLVLPGVSLLDELEKLELAGLSRHEALAASTTNAVRFVRTFIDPRANFGVVRVGARADLVLLDGDPLEDWSFVADPAGVAMRGEWLRDSRRSAGS